MKVLILTNPNVHQWLLYRCMLLGVGNVQVQTDWPGNNVSAFEMLAVIHVLISAVLILLLFIIIIAIIMHLLLNSLQHF